MSDNADAKPRGANFDFAAPAGVVAYLEARGDCGPGPFRVSELSGGNLNRVWRIIDDSGAASDSRPDRWILKHAPPFVARRPEIALDPGRLGFEARALEFLQHKLAKTADPETGLVVRGPRLFDYDSRNAVLLMEDLGDAPDLGRVCGSGPGDFAALPGCDAAGEIDIFAYGAALGRWLACLHNFDETAIDADHFRNQAVQVKRYQVQYEGAREYLKKAQVPLAAAEACGDRAVELGRRLLEPGLCLVMGDLWPASVLVTPNGMGIIDWEFAHFGRPAQDVAHLAAHLYMRTLVAGRAERKRLAEFGRAFLSAYQASAAASRLVSLDADAGAHFGCEILMRTAGPFQDGYLFAGRDPSDPVYQAAIEVALSALQDGNALKDPARPAWSLWRLFG